ncbi:hypothetical protein, partial [Chitinimonas sp.]|uniref:hypothetical protein n=1 Tax=Chitinimonas sp. TaxID=1934313 RepID=UPI0035B25C48
ATDASLSKLPVHALAVDARDVVWAGSDKGVYRSVDGGVSWQAAGKLEAAVTALQIDAQGVIYAASYAGVFKSRDGSSWESINQGIGIAGYPVPPHVNALALDTRGNLYAATSSQFGFLQILGGGVYKSSNGGASWAAVNRGLSSSENNAFDITALVTDRAGNLLAASPGFDSLNPYSGGGIFRSSDGDSGWLATGQAGLSDLRVYALALDANGRLYAGLGQGIARSDDGGASWRDASQGLSNLTVSKMVSDAAGRLFALSEQGLSRSVDGGRSWQHVASEASRGNRTILDIHADAQSPVYAAGKAVSTSIGATGTFYHEIMVLYSSSDGGASWQDLKPWYHEACAAIARSADGKVYCGDEYGRVYRIDGRHESGVLVAGSFGEGPVRKLLADSRGDLLALLKERVYRSSDGAISWQPLEPAPGLKRINAMLTDAAGTIYLAGEGGVYKSPNGNGWQALNLGLGGAAVDAMAIDANQQLYVANRLGVYQLGAIDQFWSRLAVLPGDAPVTALLVSTDAIFVGTRAAGIYRYDPAATPVNARLLNVSARANMQLGDKVGIAGFVIKGGSKTVLITARGPSLTGMGVGGALADPKLRVVDASGRVIASNDNIGVGDNSPVAGRVEGLPTEARERALLL